MLSPLAFRYPEGAALGRLMPEGTASARAVGARHAGSRSAMSGRTAAGKLTALEAPACKVSGFVSGLTGGETGTRSVP